MNRLELRKLSLEFRRLSSNLLNSTDDTADINLSRFLKFIDENELFWTLTIASSVLLPLSCKVRECRTETGSSPVCN